MVYEIGVFELGFSDSSTEISSKKGVVNNESCKVNKVSASVASTSSELMKEELEGDRSISAMEIETLNEMRPKEVCNYDQARESETQGCKIGELELMGGDLKETLQLASENQGKPPGILEQSQEKEKDKEISFLVKNTSWAEVVQKGLEVEDVHLNWKQGPKDLTFPEEGRELHTLRTDEDERDMGFKPLQEITVSGSREYMDLWAKAVDEKFNEGLSNAISDNVIETHSEGDTCSAFFSEMEPFKLIKKGKKGKRYSSLLELQDKKITEAEKKKRNKAMRRQNLNKKNLDISLSDSDLLARRDILIKEARETLKLGKKVGMQILGDEQEVVNELLGSDVDPSTTVFWELNFSGGDFFMGRSQATFVVLINLLLRGALIRFGVVFVLLLIQLMPLVQSLKI
ncbi:hypothetical protein GQ457_15G025870 [Hibiscus cannabinus]